MTHLAVKDELLDRADAARRRGGALRRRRCRGVPDDGDRGTRDRPDELGSLGGLNWLAGAMAVAATAGIANSWALLVEIKR
jgi:hypothetical protein